MNENSELAFDPVDWEQLELPDIRELLVFALSGLSDEPIDLDYITSHVSGLGTLVVQLWAELREQAVADVRARPANTDTSERDRHA